MRFRFVLAVLLSLALLPAGNALDIEPLLGEHWYGLYLNGVKAGYAKTVVEMTEGLLPGVDRDLVRPLARRVEKLFESLHLKTRVVALKEAKKGIDVTLEDNNDKSLVNFDKVLI